jgi:hypothetical protein
MQIYGALEGRDMGADRSPANDSLVRDIASHGECNEVDQRKKGT